MCNSVFFSTDSEEDYANLQSDYFSVATLDPEEDTRVEGLLGYSRRWALISKYGGCSCHFRHSMAPEFGTVEAWCPEDEEDVESTKHFYDLLSRILGQGHRLDIVDLWNDTSIEGVRSIDVFIDQLPRDEFRFFEGFRFELML